MNYENNFDNSLQKATQATRVTHYETLNVLIM